jgi:transcriptional regulator with XRE-family HTH domain
MPAILRAIRAKLKLTQEQLAERLGVSFATVNRWEGAANEPQRHGRRKRGSTPHFSHNAVNRRARFRL